MEKGFTAQFTATVTAMPRQCRRTSCIARKSIFISIGMIITQMSAPTGRLTCASSSRPSAWNNPGSHWPSAMPATMQRSTHSVSQRSKKPIAGFGAATAAALSWSAGNCFTHHRSY